MGPYQSIKMMISIKEVEHVAKLARLALSQHEKELYARQLSDIIDFFSQLQEVDTKGILPLANPLPQELVNVLRPDQVVRSPGQEAMLRSSPDKEGPFFKVPKISE